MAISAQNFIVLKIICVRSKCNYDNNISLLKIMFLHNIKLLLQPAAAVSSAVGVSASQQL